LASTLRQRISLPQHPPLWERKTTPQPVRRPLFSIPHLLTHTLGGALKLKGTKDGGITKKKKKKKSATAPRKSASAEPAEKQITVEEEKEDDDDDPYAGKTEAERRFEERRLEQMEKRLAKEGIKTHKERVEEYNKYLASLSEHHDMYVTFPSTGALRHRWVLMWWLLGRESDLANIGWEYYDGCGGGGMVCGVSHSVEVLRWDSPGNAFHLIISLLSRLLLWSNAGHHPVRLNSFISLQQLEYET